MVAAPYKKHQNDVNKKVSTHCSHTVVKLGAKQINIFGLNILLKKNKIKCSSPHCSHKK
jgi:hypothetical protein